MAIVGLNEALSYLFWLENRHIVSKKLPNFQDEIPNAWSEKKECLVRTHSGAIPTHFS